MRIDAVAAGGGQAERPTGGVDSRQDFMTLLVAQLRMQDPLSPMDPSEFMSQLAQLQTVAELTTIGSVLTQTYLDGRIDGAFALIDRTVTWRDADGGEEMSGRVESVRLTDWQCRLIVDGHEVPLSAITSVS